MEKDGKETGKWRIQRERRNGRKGNREEGNEKRKGNRKRMEAKVMGIVRNEEKGRGKREECNKKGNVMGKLKREKREL